MNVRSKISLAFRKYWSAFVFAISTILFFGFAGFWNRSDKARDSIRWHRSVERQSTFDYSTASLLSVDGGITLSWTISSTTKTLASKNSFQDDAQFHVKGFSSNSEPFNAMQDRRHAYRDYLITDGGHAFGFELLSNKFSTANTKVTYLAICAPWWFLTAVPFVVMFTAAILKIQVVVRLRKGLCVYCGYNLSKTPGRCPECGRATPAAQSRMQNS